MTVFIRETGAEGPQPAHEWPCAPEGIHGGSAPRALTEVSPIPPNRLRPDTVTEVVLGPMTSAMIVRSDHRRGVRHEQLPGS